MVWVFKDDHMKEMGCELALTGGENLDDWREREREIIVSRKSMGRDSGQHKCDSFWILPRTWSDMNETLLV